MRRVLFCLFSCHRNRFQLDLAAQEIFGISHVGHNSHPDHIDSLEHGRIAQACLLNDFPSGEFQFKELDDPKPMFIGDAKLIDPSTRKIMERIFTAFTSEPFADDSVDPVALASTAETTVVFPT